MKYGEPSAGFVTMHYVARLSGCATILMCHPVHEAMKRIHRIVRIADGAGAGLPEADDALRAAACQPISIVGHAIERVEAHRLRRDVDIFHCLVERRHTDDV